MKIISAGLVCLAGASAIQAQTLPRAGDEMLTPRFVPEPKQEVGPANYAESNSGAPPSSFKLMPSQVLEKLGASGNPLDQGMTLQIELPGDQTLFRRDSEADLYTRIAQDTMRVKGQPAIFPVEQPITREPYRPRVFAQMKAQVEPLFVLHGRLLFEQPNFERSLYDFGIIQPGVNLGIFWYDVAMMPYHYFENPRSWGESNLGKPLPGDQAPFTIPIERFSVTGAVGEVGAILGGAYLFP